MTSFKIPMNINLAGFTGGDIMDKVPERNSEFPRESNIPTLDIRYLEINSLVTIWFHVF